VPDNLIESELFGHGSFTEQFLIKWEKLTNGGTLFLDEIGIFQSLSK
jgi:transcriptional regulator with GAF, ATPase, and Fis domain